MSLFWAGLIVGIGLAPVALFALLAISIWMTQREDQP